MKFFSKKIFTSLSIIIAMSLWTIMPSYAQNLYWLPDNPENSSLEFGYDLASPIVLVDAKGSEPKYYYFPSYINRLSIPTAPAWCIFNSRSDRLQYKVTFGANALVCWPSSANINTIITNILKESHVWNLVNIYWKITERGWVPDLTIPRFFLVSRDVKLSRNGAELEYIEETWDIYYNASWEANLISIFDPDQATWTLDNLYSNESTSPDKLTPSLTVSAYTLDSWRITDSLLWSWLYTIEHYAWKKYTQNNGRELQTKSFDGLDLYNMTYYDQVFLPIWDWTKFCNKYNITAKDYNDIKSTNTLKVYQSKDTNKTREANRLAPFNERQLYCSWTSWLRVNKSFHDAILSSWSIKLTANYNGSSINSKVERYNGEDVHYLSFDPRSTDGKFGEIKIPNKWFVWNIRDLRENERENIRDLRQRLWNSWTTLKLYYLVKVNLLFENYSKFSFPNTNCWAKDNWIWCKQWNQWLVWFDPINNGWYNYENHKIVSNINNLNVNKIEANKSTLIYKSLFWWNVEGVSFTSRWEGNIFIPFGNGWEVYGISTPWFTMTPEEYSDNPETQNKMKYRGINIALTSASWYSMSEYAKNPKNKQSITWQDKWASLTISSRAVINPYWEKEIRAIYNRNADADSELDASKFGTNTDRDENVWYQIMSKSSLNIQGVEKWVEMNKVLAANNEESYLFNIPWFKTDFSIANANACKWAYLIPQNWHQLFWIKWPKETNNPNCTWVNTIKRLSGNAWTTGWILDLNEWFQQWIEWVVEDKSISPISQKWLYLMNFYDNFNDKEVLNQIFNISNIPEHLWEAKIQCLLWIYKIPLKNPSLYKEFKDSGKNFNAIEWYNTDTELFKNTRPNKNINYELVNKLLSLEYNAREIEDYKNTYYKIDDNKHTFDFGYSDWNVWEKWFASYYCNNLPNNKRYEVSIYNDNTLYTNTKTVKTKDWDFKIFEEVREKWRWRKVDFNETNALWYNWNWQISTNPLFKNFLIRDLNYINFKWNPPESRVWTDTTLWFNTKDIITVDHAKWWMEFVVTDDSEDKFTKLSIVVKDKSTDNIIYSNEHYLRITWKKEAIEITNSKKYEQKLEVWYKHKDVTFDGKSNGWDSWLSYTLTNTVWANATCPADLWKNNVKPYILIDSLTNSLKDNNSVAKTVLATCSEDEKYKCIENANDTGNAHQNTNVIFEKFVENNWIKILQTRKWQNTVTSYLVVKWEQPLQDRFVAKLVDTANWLKAIKLYFPTWQEFFPWESSYEIKFSLPENTFVWTEFWKDLPNWNLNAISIIPRIQCENPNKTSEIPVGLNPIVPADNFYQKLKVWWEPSDASCNIKIVDSSNKNYWSSWNVEVYVSEDAARANWKTCSSENVLCLFEFKWVLTPTSIDGMWTFEWTTINELIDWQGIAGQNYNMAIKVKVNWLNNTWTAIATEKELLDKAMDVNTIVEFNGDLNINRWYLSSINVQNLSSQKYKHIVSSQDQNHPWLTFAWLYGKNVRAFYHDNTTRAWRPITLNNTLNGINLTNASLLWYNTNVWVWYRSVAWASSSDTAKEYYIWLNARTKTEAKPSANITLEFKEKNVPAPLQNKTCNFVINDFPDLGKCEPSEPRLSDLTIKSSRVDMYTEAKTLDDMLYWNDWTGNALDTCNVWVWTDKAFSLEYQKFKWKIEEIEVWESIVKKKVPSQWVVYSVDVYNPSECALGWYTKENGNPISVKISLKNAWSYKKCLVNIEQLKSDFNVTENDITVSNSWVEIRNMDLPADMTSKPIEIWCAIKDAEPKCSPYPITGEAVLTYEKWTIKSNETQVRTCMVPTVQFNDPGEVRDWNANNDVVQSLHSAAYPFELQQCWILSQNWSFDYKGWCWMDDPALKQLKLRWYKWQGFDDLNRWRDFFGNLTIPEVAWVAGVNKWEYYEWDLSNANASDLLWKSHSLGISIWTDTIWQMKSKNSYFELINETGWKVKFELKQSNRIDRRWNIIPLEWPRPICNENWLSCKSQLLHSWIWKDPEIIWQKIYDNWIMKDPDDNMTVFLHKEEIDGTSKKGTKDGQPHYEPVQYQTKLTNPEVNRNYGLWDLKFDLTLWMSAPLFKELNSDFANVWNDLLVTANNIVWNAQTLWLGEEKDFIASVILDPTLKRVANPFLNPPIEWNWTYKGEGTPTLKIYNSQCNYKLTETPVVIEVDENPIVVNSFSFEDDTPPRVSGQPNQHLPWDKITFTVDIENRSTTYTWKDVFVNFEFNNNEQITDSNLRTNLKQLFTLEWNRLNETDPYYNIPLTEIPSEGLKCWMDETRLICIITNPIQPRHWRNINIPLRINIHSEMYEKFKRSRVEEKYWYPITIDRIRYWTPDLNKINEVVYYSSDMNNIPSGWNMWDFKEKDMNNPNNITRSPSPRDWNYNFYLWIPYITITNEIINNSIWHFSPWDIITFKTTVQWRSKADIRDLILNQELYKGNLKTDFLDTEILKVKYTADKTNFTNSTKEVNFEALNSDNIPWNDVVVKDIENIRIQNNFIKNQDNELIATEQPVYNVEGTNVVLFSDWDRYSYLDWTQDPDNVPWWEIVIETKVRLLWIKPWKQPQIWCSISPTPWCDRENSENPKSETEEGYADIPYVGTDRDAYARWDYLVYFPILKSMLFQQPSNNSYIPTNGANIITWQVNNPNTKVVYRVDNFIPTWYDFATKWIWKARLPVAHIKLPVWVSYVPWTLKKVENLKDSYPYWTEVSAGIEPRVNTASEYSVVEGSTNTFDNSFLNPSSGWKLVDRTNWKNYAILKWTPFGFNFFNEAYNFFRLTDDGWISLWYKNKSSSLDEGLYLQHKNTWIIEARENIEVLFSKNTGWVKLPNNTRYTDMAWKELVSLDENQEVVIKAGTKVKLLANNSILFNQWMEGVTVSDITKTIKFKSSVNYTDSSLAWYKYIAPIFAKLDLSDEDKKGHGIYEKVLVDNTTNKPYALAFQWYGYIDGTKKEVKYWVVLYDSKNFNSIRFTYWDFDNTLDIPAISWISNGSIYKLSTYNGRNLRELNNWNDVLFDASTIYQELVFEVGYEPNSLDPVRWKVLDYEEREKTPPHLFIDKPQSRTAFTFNVNIQWDAMSCQTEYTESLGGSTLRWNRLNSLSNDLDDVDTFCFQAERPWIAIIENGSYAKGWYKSSQRSCVVNHLSVMWFNGNSIWWNENKDNTCWITYNIKVKKKELTLDTTSPFLLLSEFSDKVDTRPVDFNKLIENQDVEFNQPTIIKIVDENGSQTLSNKIPDFRSKWIKLLEKGTIYVYWHSASENKSYVLYSRDNAVSFKIVKEFAGKVITNMFVYDSNVQAFFSDWSYARNLNSWSWDWETNILPNFTKINEIKYKSNSAWYIVWDKAAMWKTTNAWRSYEYVDISALTWISKLENINTLDVYWSNDLWLATSWWNVLYSNNSWNSFVKKTIESWSSDIKYTLEDDSLIFKNASSEVVWTNDTEIDNNWSKSIKFDTLWLMPISEYPVFKQNNSIINIDNFEIPVLENTNGSYLPLGKYKLNLYVSDKSSIRNIDRLIFMKDDNNNSGQLEIDVKKLLTSQNKKLTNGVNEIEFIINSASNDNYRFRNITNFTQNSNLNFTKVKIITTEEFNVWNWDKVWILWWEFSPISNLATTINIENLESNSTATIDNWTLISLKDDNSLNFREYVYWINQIKGFLVFDLYIQDINKTVPGNFILWSMLWMNGTPNWLEWQNISQFTEEGRFVNWWNKVKIPLNSSSNQIGNIQQLSWSNINIFALVPNNLSDFKHNSFAIDNIWIVTVEPINYKFIRFFNTKEWILFSNDKTYTTSDNNTFQANQIDASWSFNFLSASKLRWREVYSVLQWPNGWWTYYSLNKGNSSSVLLSNWNVNLLYADIIDYNDWVAISDQNIIYRMNEVAK